MKMFFITRIQITVFRPTGACYSVCYSVSTLNKAIVAWRFVHSVYHRSCYTDFNFNSCSARTHLVLMHSVCTSIYNSNSSYLNSSDFSCQFLCFNLLKHPFKPDANLLSMLTCIVIDLPRCGRSSSKLITLYVRKGKSWRAYMGVWRALLHAVGCTGFVPGQEGEAPRSWRDFS